MFSSTLGLVLAAVVVTVSVMGIGYFIIQRRKSSPGEDINVSIDAVWSKIRPIISECVIDLLKLTQAEKMGYDAMVEYAVDYIKSHVTEADFLTQEEKDQLTPEIIKLFIEPTLKKIYEKEMAEQG